jgi:hypothetical protein
MKSHNRTKRLQSGAMLALLFIGLLVLAVLIHALAQRTNLGAMAGGAGREHPATETVTGAPELPERTGTRYDLRFGRPDLALP